MREGFRIIGISQKLVLEKSTMASELMSTLLFWFAFCGRVGHKHFTITLPVAVQTPRQVYNDWVTGVPQLLGFSSAVNRDANRRFVSLSLLYCNLANFVSNVSKFVSNIFQIIAVSYLNYCPLISEPPSAMQLCS
jgi:hypothetical protein